MTSAVRKSQKAHLVPIQKLVTRDGKTFWQTYFVSPEEAKEHHKTGKLFTTAEDFGAYTKKLTQEQRQQIADLAKERGIQWNPSDKPMVDWMRAAMKIKEHIRQGNHFHLPVVHEKPQTAPAPKAKANETLSGQTFDNVDEFKKFTKKLTPEQRTKLMEDAEKQGISWEKTPNPGINWMRAAMAIHTHIKSGGKFQVGREEKPNPTPVVPINTPQQTQQPAQQKAKIDEFFDKLGLPHSEQNGAYIIGQGHLTVTNKWGKQETAPGSVKLNKIVAQPKWGTGHFIQLDSSFFDKDTIKAMGGKWGGTVDKNDTHWYLPFNQTVNLFKKFHNVEISAQIAPTMKAVFERLDVSNTKPADPAQAAKPNGPWKFEMPKGMNPNLKLYDHQKAGVEFAINNKRVTLGMAVGLGKTLTAITAGKELLNQGKVKRILVIAPASVKFNWKNEIEQFSDAKACVLESDALRKKDAENLWKEAENSQYIIVNYDMLRKPEIADRLYLLCPDAVIADEGHKLKNASSQQTQEFRDRWGKATYKWILSATPYPNGQPKETYTMLQHVAPHKVGKWTDFMRRFVVTETIRAQGRTIEKPIMLKNLPQLKKMMEDVVFIRTHSSPDVNSSMPKERHFTYQLAMEPKQEKMYKAMQDEIASELRNMTDQGYKANATVVLAKMKRLEQIAIDPDMLQTDPNKIDMHHLYPKEEWAVNTIVDHLQDANNRGIVVFCDMLLPLDKIRVGLEDNKVDPSKIAYITGDVKPEERQRIVEKFSKGEVKVVLCTSAAEEGVNLQKGSHTLIHLDVPWVPKSITQREGRVLRQGQPNSFTTFHTPIMEGTVEDRKRGKLGVKVGTIESLLGSGSAGSAANNVSADDRAKSLSLDDIKAILGVK